MPRVLAVETSCDETSAAVLSGSSQTPILEAQITLSHAAQVTTLRCDRPKRSSSENPSAAAFEGLAEGGFEVLEVFSGDDLGDDSAVGLCGVRVREGDLCFEDGGLRAA